MISDDEPHLDEAVCEAHPEVVLAMLGRGVDQPSAHRARHVQPGQQRSRDTTLTIITIIITIVTGEGPSPGTRQTAHYLVAAAETSMQTINQEKLLGS